MQNRINTIQPEITAEQIFSYSIQWYEALKIAKREIKSDYNFALIPNWFHLYTGILQTTWHMVLDSEKESLVIISRQTNNSEKIEIYNQKIWPILWFYFDWLSFSSKNKLYTQTENTPSDLEFQLNIARIINNTKSYIHIGIWSEVKYEDIVKLTKHLDKYSDSSNFIFLSNLSEEKEIKFCKTIDTKMIEDISMKKNIQGNNIMNAFVCLSRDKKLDIEILMYANSGDLDGNTKKTSWYVCMVC